MATSERTIARLTLRVERGKAVVEHLNALAREASNVLKVRRDELRTAQAVVAAKRVKKKKR